ncbi:hypothetical protein A2761_01420 [Candidatus Kaiserbacteria bacterium RIFCSPHIGHO2_01_FULL_51_33]|uniref:Carbohydrate kinase PfkB domain-containing protein n=1 Tax=Candidatus Kaiserbacteria bacterium RIFCSPLOWO2_01_FULL_51_21 TaxID=1798508 RepID=A0A1F6ECK8_9BACT|nr:MAG: hypothetical protein A2761_01420 [Candidatus Kaiserbacteria bacterium RIFCSPHIGHO2_01_FULL_51_33]OGG71413.1 MAG: hypothetical protein A3A35_01570 [Candidatus Kaiserbacteria bacterium RIFCSPLOWO2_01_FULL_51_21]
MADLLKEAREKPVVVLGDVMLDEFVHCMKEDSPEPPGLKLWVTNTEYRLGGAANVALNIARLGGRALLVGVTGDDENAKMLRHKLVEQGRYTIEAFLVIDPSRPTTVKTRFLSGGVAHLRVDREKREFISGPVEKQLKVQLAGAIDEVLGSPGSLIVSDYQKGVVTGGSGSLFQHVLHSRVPVYVDPKYRPAEFYRGVDVITPNLKEASELVGRTLDTPQEIEEAGPELLKATVSKAVLVTQGEDGMTLFGSSEDPLHIPAIPVKEADTVGAGDTVISTLALMRAVGATFAEAAIIANAAAGIVVSKVGTATCSPEELLAQFVK